jgi:hypothetical protein
MQFLQSYLTGRFTAIDLASAPMRLLGSLRISAFTNAATSHRHEQIK